MSTLTLSRPRPDDVRHRPVEHMPRTTRRAAAPACPPLGQRTADALSPPHAAPPESNRRTRPLDRGTARVARRGLALAASAALAALITSLGTSAPATPGTPASVPTTQTDRPTDSSTVTPPWCGTLHPVHGCSQAPAPQPRSPFLAAARSDKAAP